MAVDIPDMLVADPAPGTAAYRLQASVAHRDPDGSETLPRLTLGDMVFDGFVDTHRRWYVQLFLVGPGARPDHAAATRWAWGLRDRAFAEAAAVAQLDPEASVLWRSNSPELVGALHLALGGTGVEVDLARPDPPSEHDNQTCLTLALVAWPTSVSAQLAAVRRQLELAGIVGGLPGARVTAWVSDPDQPVPEGDEEWGPSPTLDVADLDGLEAWLALHDRDNLLGPDIYVDIRDAGLRVELRSSCGYPSVFLCRPAGPALARWEELLERSVLLWDPDGAAVHGFSDSNGSALPGGTVTYVRDDVELVVPEGVEATPWAAGRLLRTDRQDLRGELAVRRALRPPRATYTQEDYLRDLPAAISAEGPVEGTLVVCGSGFQARYRQAGKDVLVRAVFTPGWSGRGMVSVAHDVRFWREEARDTLEALARHACDARLEYHVSRADVAAALGDGLADLGIRVVHTPPSEPDASGRRLRRPWPVRRVGLSLVVPAPRGVDQALRSSLATWLDLLSGVVPLSRRPRAVLLVGIGDGRPEQCPVDDPRLGSWLADHARAGLFDDGVVVFDRGPDCRLDVRRVGEDVRVRVTAVGDPADEQWRSLFQAALDLWRPRGAALGRTDEWGDAVLPVGATLTYLTERDDIPERLLDVTPAGPGVVVSPRLGREPAALAWLWERVGAYRELD